MIRTSNVAQVSIAWVALLSLAGCDGSGQASAPTPPPEVSIVTVEATQRRVLRELPGRIAPTRVAEVRSRVSGIIIERHFKQGSDVKAGDILYQVDPKPFEVEIRASEAALAKAQALLEQNRLQEKRIATLVETRAASIAQHETAIANLRQSEAEVAAREADVARAKLNLDYAAIKAPISGRIGRALVTEGALVMPGETSHVATIHQLDPVYVDFTQSVAELNRLRRDFDNGALARIAPDAAKVRIVLDDGQGYELPGKLVFSDATVDPSTGQVKLRAELDNPKHELLAGMYVRVQIEDGIDSKSIAIPQQAVQRNAGGGSEVFVVKADNRVAVQAVRTGAVLDNLWLVQHGLSPGDRVIVEGFQKFSAGDLVTPLPWQGVRAASADGSREERGFAANPVSMTR